MNYGGWKIVNACVEGSSHIETQTPCQDSYLTKFIETDTRNNPILVMAISDGAGSALYSKDGADLVCQHAIEIVNSYFLSKNKVDDITEEIAIEWICRIREYVLNHAANNQHNIREYAATILMAILSDTYGVFIQIGDGAIIIGNRIEYDVIFWPQNGEYLNSTYFITETNVIENVQFSIVDKKIQDIAMMTDGLQMLALQYNTKQVHSPFLLPMFNRLDSSNEDGENTKLNSLLIEYLNSQLINNKTDDDKTLILATRKMSNHQEMSGH